MCDVCVCVLIVGCVLVLFVRQASPFAGPELYLVLGRHRAPAFGQVSEIDDALIACSQLIRPKCHAAEHHTFFVFLSCCLSFLSSVVAFFLT